MKSFIDTYITFGSIFPTVVIIIAFLWKVYNKKEGSKFPFQLEGYSWILMSGFFAWGFDGVFYNHDRDFKFMDEHYIIISLYCFITGSSMLYDEYMVKKNKTVHSFGDRGWILGVLFVGIGIYLFNHNIK